MSCCPEDPATTFCAICVRRLRQDVPVMMLTARGQTKDREMAQFGATVPE
jgi:DNA-binding response OmpR family regulator